MKQDLLDQLVLRMRVAPLHHCVRFPEDPFPVPVDAAVHQQGDGDDVYAVLVYQPLGQAGDTVRNDSNRLHRSLAVSPDFDGSRVVRHDQDTKIARLPDA